MVDAQLAGDPAIRPSGRLPQLVGDKLPPLLVGQLPPCQVEGSGQAPLLPVGEVDVAREAGQRDAAVNGHKISVKPAK